MNSWALKMGFRTEQSVGAWFLHFTFLFIQSPSTSAFRTVTLGSYFLLNLVYETCRPFTQKLFSYPIFWHTVILYFFIKFWVQIPELLWQVLVILQANQNLFLTLVPDASFITIVCRFNAYFKPLHWVSMEKIPEKFWEVWNKWLVIPVNVLIYTSSFKWIQLPIYRYKTRDLDKCATCSKLLIY